MSRCGEGTAPRRRELLYTGTLGVNCGCYSLVSPPANVKYRRLVKLEPNLVHRQIELALY